MTMPDLMSSSSVQTWIRSAKLEEPSRHLRLLGEFCSLVEREPDQMISECLKLVQEGQFKLRGKTRRQYVERIDEFEDAHGGRTQGNVIRSFFIHNGIPIQPPILT
jgi:hypothetical protein